MFFQKSTQTLTIFHFTDKKEEQHIKIKQGKQQQEMKELKIIKMRKKKKIQRIFQMIITQQTGETISMRNEDRSMQKFSTRKKK